MKVISNGLWGDKAVSVRQTVNAISQIPIYYGTGGDADNKKWEQTFQDMAVYNKFYNNLERGLFFW